MQRELKKKKCIFQRLSSHLIRGFRDVHLSIKLCRALCLLSGCWCVWTVFLNDKASLSLLKLTPADGVTHWILCPLQRPWFPRQTDGRTHAHRWACGEPKVFCFIYPLDSNCISHSSSQSNYPASGCCPFFFEAGRIGEETPIIRLREASLRY